MKKDMKHKKPRMTILTSDKIVLKTEYYLRREGYLIKIK